MLVIALVIASIILLLLILRLLQDRFEWIRKVYKAIKTRIMYNALLRYVM